MLAQSADAIVVLVCVAVLHLLSVAVLPRLHRLLVSLLPMTAEGSAAAALDHRIAESAAKAKSLDTPATYAAYSEHRRTLSGLLNQRQQLQSVVLAQQARQSVYWSWVTYLHLLGYVGVAAYYWNSPTLVYLPFALPTWNFMSTSDTVSLVSWIPMCRTAVIQLGKFV